VASAKTNNRATVLIFGPLSNTTYPIQMHILLPITSEIKGTIPKGGAKPQGEVQQYRPRLSNFALYAIYKRLHAGWQEWTCSTIGCVRDGPLPDRLRPDDQGIVDLTHDSCNYRTLE
jgi:hypothetical protein